MKTLTVAAMMAFASYANAAAPNFSALKPSEASLGKHSKCAMEAWTATNPSQDQQDSADAFITQAKDVYEAQKPAIDAAKATLMAAWKTHPIVQADVVAAEMPLHDAVKPVMEAGRDAGINILNLLTADQRSTFDQTFADCAKAKNPNP